MSFLAQLGICTFWPVSVEVQIHWAKEWALEMTLSWQRMEAVNSVVAADLRSRDGGMANCAFIAFFFSFSFGILGTP